MDTLILQATFVFPGNQFGAVLMEWSLAKLISDVWTEVITIVIPNPNSCHRYNRVAHALELGTLLFCQSAPDCQCYHLSTAESASQYIDDWNCYMSVFCRFAKSSARLHASSIQVLIEKCTQGDPDTDQVLFDSWSSLKTKFLERR